MNLWQKRGLAIAIGTLAGLSPVAGGAAMQVIESGTWTCCVCGLEEERTTCLGVLLAGDVVEPRRSDIAGQFHQWFKRSVRLEHGHDWIPVGCHSSQGAIHCYFGIRARDFYISLPALPDPEIAGELVTRMIARDPRGRRELLADLERDPGPFADVAQGRRPTRAEFAAAYQAWSAAHPLWR